MKALSNSVCIVGVDESDEIGILPGKSQLSLHLEAITNAVGDAGLRVSDVDGVFTAGQHSTALIGEALGITPRYVDGTTVGGCSFTIMVEHAAAALHHGLCDVAVICHGESGRSGVGVSPRRDTSVTGQYEIPFGFGAAPTNFCMVTTRHMHEYGTTLEQWAQVAVSTREWACLNPKAQYRTPLTIEDVLKSRPVVYPFNLLNICLVTDAGGAVVLTRADRARDCAKKPVYVRGMGEATEHVSLTQMRSLTFSEATRMSGERAFTMAGVTHRDLDHAPHHLVARDARQVFPAAGVVAPHVVQYGQAHAARLYLHESVVRADGRHGNFLVAQLAAPLVQHLRVHRLRRHRSFERTRVPAAESIPPMPLTSESFIFGTWRAPHSPRSCRVASMMGKMPYMPECV